MILTGESAGGKAPSWPGILAKERRVLANVLPILDRVLVGVVAAHGLGRERAVGLDWETLERKEEAPASRVSGTVSFVQFW